MNVGNVHLTAANSCKDTNRSTCSAESMFVMTSRRSTVVFIGELPPYVLVLIEGCATLASGEDDLVVSVMLLNDRC